MRLLFAGLISACCIAWLFGCATKHKEFAVPESLPGLANPSLHIMVSRTKQAPVTGTFGWGHSIFKVPAEPGVNISAINSRLHTALSADLSGKGMTFAESNPDIIVSYALSAGGAIDCEELNNAYGDLLDAKALKKVPEMHYKHGVLVVDIVARKSGHLLWRGAIMGEVDMNWPEERKQERCNEEIEALLHHYPFPVEK